MTATILAAVERQLTRHVATLSEREEATRKANRAYQTALQTALEERLTEFANHQHWRVNDLEDKIAALPTGVDPETLIELRQTVRDDIESSLGPIRSRVEELAEVDTRSGERLGAFVRQVEQAMTSLAERVDAGDRRAGEALEQQLATIRAELDSTVSGAAEQVTQQSVTLQGKIDQAESRGVDRLLELERRIGDDLGTKIAHLDATIGRVASGFDEAMLALNQRLLDLENKLYDFHDRLEAVAAKAATFDETLVADLRAEMSTAVGEAMLVRIELDRMVAATNERMDKQTIRMSEIEALVADQADVSTAVQLERLDELERQMAMIAAPPGVTSAARPQSFQTPGSVLRSPPSMSLDPRTTSTDNDDRTHESESSTSTR